MGVYHLTIFILHQVTFCTVQNTWMSIVQWCGMLTSFDATSCSLNSDQLNLRIGNKRVKNTHCIRPSSNTSNDRFRKSIKALYRLITQLSAYNRIEVSHNHWIWMWARNTPDNIIGIIYISDPISHGFI